MTGTNDMNENLLQEAIMLARSGKKMQAYQILSEIVREQPENVKAWLWLVDSVPTDEERVRLLEQCLQINPEQQSVQRALVGFRKKIADAAKDVLEKPADSQPAEMKPPQKSKIISQEEKVSETIGISPQEDTPEILKVATQDEEKIQESAGASTQGEDLWEEDEEDGEVVEKPITASIRKWLKPALIGIVFVALAIAVVVVVRQLFFSPAPDVAVPDGQPVPNSTFSSPMDESPVVEENTPITSANSDGEKLPPALMVEEGLILYYNFDEDSAGVVQDLSDSWMSGILSGTSFSPDGVSGGALQFDGQSDSILINAAPPLFFGTQMTMAVFFKANDYNSPRPLLEWYDVKNEKSGVQVWAFNEGVSGAKLTSGEEQEEAIIETVAPSAQTWHHLAVTFDGASGQARLYLDGALVQEKTMESKSLMTLYDLYIGSSHQNDGAYFYGSLDEVRIYDRTLSDAEISELAAVLKGE